MPGHGDFAVTSGEFTVSHFSRRGIIMTLQFFNELDFLSGETLVDDNGLVDAELDSVSQENTRLALIKSGSFEMLIDWLLLFMIRKLTRVDRIVYLKFDKKNSIWNVIADYAPDCARLLPDQPYQLENEVRLEIQEINKLVVSPQKNIGADAHVKYIFNGSMYLLLFDDTSSARSFADEEKMRLRVLVENFYQTMGLRYSIPQEKFRHFGRKDPTTALGNRRVFVTSLLNGAFGAIVSIDIDHFDIIERRGNYYEVEGTVKSLADILIEQRNKSDKLNGEFYRFSRGHIIGLLGPKVYSNDNRVAETDLKAFLKEAQQKFSHEVSVKFNGENRAGSFSAGICLRSGKSLPCFYAANAAMSLVKDDLGGGEIRMARIKDPKSFQIVGKTIVEIKKLFDFS